MKALLDLALAPSTVRSWRFLAIGVLIVGGLAFTGYGAWITSKAVILTKEQALYIGMAQFNRETPQENLELPAVKNLLAQSAAASSGLKFIMVGSGLQALGTIVWLLFDCRGRL
jgi:hypothetical protein